jgi:glycosyltransferase involved in cell wall biosynthesis
MRQVEKENTSIDVLVIDNGQCAETAALCKSLEKKWPFITYEREPKLGLSFARNCGAMKATGHYICYLDDDAIPGSVYLLHLIKILKKYKPDFAGGPIFPYYTTRKPFWFQNELETRKHSKISGFVDCPISGGNFIVRKRLLEKIGMFSSRFGMIGKKLRLGEERNLLERYRALTKPSSRRIYYSQNCYIYHHVPPEKMKFSYLLIRSFESGCFQYESKFRMIGNENAIFQITNKNNADTLYAMIKGKSGVHLSLRVLHYAFKLAGWLFAYSKKYLQDTK